ncbi:helix-turn-helix domain-containing protein [Bacteroides heparinolyticus]|uniref:helix-turn-helix domain-containing protein n=1 Tax=Prevotella heparinolytica TaxID=28113 RepID=UPI0035A03B83
MENRTIKELSFEDLKPYSSQFMYMDDYVMMTDQFQIPSLHPEEAVRMQFLLIVLCQEGYVQLDVNGKNYQLNAYDVLICLPTMVLSRIMFSPGTRIRMTGFSIQFLNRAVKKEEGMDNMFFYLNKHPIQRPCESGKPPLAHYYEQLIKGKINSVPGRFHKDILQHLFSAFFCEVMSVLYEHAGKEEQQQGGGIKRGSYVFKQFLMELSKANGMHRTVNYFADRLCYSPKYVSAVIKQVSGRTAMEWINEYAIEQIKLRLKHSDKSIKEIADEFNFSNQSFFGKYVKAHLGMSPAQYRREPEK